MIEYLIRSAICLGTLIVAYRIFLEKEHMHRFNRFFLLFSLVFGVLIPLVDLPVTKSTHLVFNDGVSALIGKPSSGTVTEGSREPGPAIDFGRIALSIYFLVAAIFFLRFLAGGLAITVRIRRSRRVKIPGATLVLMAEQKTPHSFLGYIFVKDEAYLEKRIDERVLLHEMTHVRQHHSLDILLAELLQTVFWFNPVFILYKKAIRLNHEFLADDAVVVSGDDVRAYQLLLLQTVGTSPGSLTSNFNYSLTKKRLIMMTKHTPRTKAAFVGSAIAIIVLFSGFGFTGRTYTYAEEKAPSASTTPLAAAVDEGSISPEVYFKGATIWLKNKAGKYEAKSYEAMTAAEKAMLPPIPPFRGERRTPTAAEFASWKDPARYPITILDQGYRLNREDPANLRPDDYVAYFTIPTNLRPHSFSNKSSKWVRYTRVLLMTERHYQERFIKPRFEPNKVLTVGYNGPKLYYYTGPPVPAPAPGKKAFVTFPAP